MSRAQPLIRHLARRPHICCACLQRISKHEQKKWITQNHLRKIKVAEEEWNSREQDIKIGQKKSILELLEERGYINQIIGSRDDLNNLLIERRVGAYVGVDPTAQSLHVGHMVPFMALGWMYIHGYGANFLLGGFTASIGDPTDRLTAREEKNRVERKTNMLAMHMQLKRLGKSMETYAERRGYIREWAWRRALLNNNTWWQKLSVAEFMKRLGVGMRVGPMLGRDSVKNRLEKGDGMSFAEFSYPLIQGWDWWEQFQQGVQVQIGGADQFGNILAGAEAVKYLSKTDLPFAQKLAADTKGSKATTDPMGFTVPLLTTSSGEKFGKSAGNAVWINPDMTNSFDLYQFFLRSADADVERYLKLLTFIPTSEIKSIMEEHEQDQSKRVAQHKLAYDFVQLVHGLEAANKAAADHKQVFSKQLTIGDLRLQAETNTTASFVAAHRPPDLHPSLNKHAKPLDMHSNTTLNLTLPQSLVFQQPLSRILWSAGLVASRSEGQRLINNRGVYIGGRGIKSGDDTKVKMDDTVNYTAAIDSKWSYVQDFLLEGNVLVLRVGKWKVKIVKILPDSEFEALGLTCPGWKEDSEQTTDMTQNDLHEEESYRREQQETAGAKASREDKSRRVGTSPYGQVKDARFSRERQSHR